MKRRDLLQGLGIAVSGRSMVRAAERQATSPDAGAPLPEKGTGRTAITRSYAPGDSCNRPLVQVDAKALRLLDEMEERAAKYFFEQADPTTGSIYDRARANGMGLTEGGITRTYRSASSISATGFGLSGLCVAAERGYLSGADCEQRVETVLDFFSTRCQHKHGFFTITSISQQVPASGEARFPPLIRHFCCAGYCIAASTSTRKK